MRLAFSCVAVAPILLAVVTGSAKAELGSTAIPKDLQYRYIEGSNTTFRMTRAGLRGSAASQGMAVLNYFGTKKEVSDGLLQQEPNIKRLLRESRLTRGFVFVEPQTSNTDGSIT